MGKGGRYREKGAGGAGEWWVGGWVGVMVRGWGGGGEVEVGGRVSSEVVK